VLSFASAREASRARLARAVICSCKVIRET
jgi:hypothetical protein